MEQKPKVQLIYKKSIFVELVRLDHNFLYSTRNRENEKYQVYAFEWTEELQKDIARLTGHEYEKR